MKCRKPEQIQRQGGSIGVCRQANENQTAKLDPKQTQMCLLHSIRRRKASPVLAASCLGHDRNITVFGYNVKSLFIKHCPLWMQGKRTTRYQRFLWDSDITHHYFSLWKKKERERMKYIKKERKKSFLQDGVPSPFVRRLIMNAKNL